MKTLPPKFVIKIHSQEHSKVVQNRLFELGYKWADEKVTFKTDAWSSYGRDGLVIYVGVDSKDGRMTYGSVSFQKSSYSTIPFITTDDLFSAEKEIVVKVKLNSEYEATISKAGIVVGCQTFPLDIVEKLMAAKNKLTDGE